MELLPPLDITIDIVLLFLLCILSIAIVQIRNLLITTILLGIFSLLMAAMYLSLSAPDVAITEAAVGAGISTILLLLAITLTGKKEKRAHGNKFFPLLAVIAFAGTLIYASVDMPPFSTADAQIHKHIVPYYLEQSIEDTKVPNVVTSILASYRGFDTLGETFVIFTAAISVVLLLGQRFKRRGPLNDE